MNPGMLNKLKKMQQEIQAAQEKIEASEFVGKASGITAIVQGTRQLIEVKIDPEMIDELELVQDAIVLAVNDALSQIDQVQEETMGQFSGGMGGLGF